MPECANCGEHVTARFVRVFGTNEGGVDGCPQCRTYEELFDGVAARQ